MHLWWKVVILQVTVCIVLATVTAQNTIFGIRYIRNLLLIHVALLLMVPIVQ